MKRWTSFANEDRKMFKSKNAKAGVSKVEERIGMGGGEENPNDTPEAGSSSKRIRLQMW
jgi:hypothetical protein